MKKSLESRVKEANRRYFDLTAKTYETTDGRRGKGLESYVKKNLKKAASVAGANCLLDVGCGSGFVAGCAESIFEKSVGTDISPKIVKEASCQHSNQSFLVSDCDHLPFADAHFDVVSSLAVLHHLPTHEDFFREVYRVLKKGGVLYTDHDIEKQFNRYFSIPLWFYRKIRNERKKYLSSCSALTDEMYELTEYHRNGLEVQVLRQGLERAGFSNIRFVFHWQGLSDFFDILGVFKRIPHGLAPSVSIWARK